MGMPGIDPDEMGSIMQELIELKHSIEQQMTKCLL